MRSAEVETPEAVGFEVVEVETPDAVKVATPESKVVEEAWLRTAKVETAGFVESIASEV